nr:MAG TPA: hypothetical protein [Caudoviricetes sp.]
MKKVIICSILNKEVSNKYLLKLHIAYILIYGRFEHNESSLR